MSSNRECQFSSFVEVIDSIPWADVCSVILLMQVCKPWRPHLLRLLFMIARICLSSGKAQAKYSISGESIKLLFFLLHIYIILNYIAFTSFMLTVKTQVSPFCVQLHVVSLNPGVVNELLVEICSLYSFSASGSRDLSQSNNSKRFGWYCTRKALYSGTSL